MLKGRIMRTSSICVAPVLVLSLAAVFGAGCGGTSADDLNKMLPSSGSAAVGTAGTSPVVGGSSSTGGTGVISGTGGSAGSAGSAVIGTGGNAGTATAGGSGGATGTAGSGGMAGAGGAPPTGPYAPRTGPFKMLVYEQTLGFHHDSITEGTAMLQAIAQKQGFEITVATDPGEINAAGLAKYEIIFHMNSTGEIFNPEQRQAYEDWMKTAGAYGGVHSATDTAQSWTFYKELNGQYYDLHNACCATADVRWTAAGEGSFTAKGIPNPWTRAEEWYKFDKNADWSAKAGFTILSNVTTNDGGTRPVSLTREWGNFRSFYTSLGHQSDTFKDPLVIKHVTAGIMWAVRREALLKP